MTSHQSATDLMLMLILDNDGICGARAHSINLKSLWYFLSASTQHTETHINKSKDHYHAEDQDRHRLKVILTRMEARKNTLLLNTTASALVLDCLKHVQTLNRGDSRQKED